MLSALVTVFAALFLLNSWLYFQQSAMIFFPYRELSETPSDWSMPYEDVYLTTEDGVQLHGWYIPSPQAKNTLLFFHGNAGNISHRADSVAIFHRLGLNVFIFDYRGYGHSQGKPSEKGLYLDAAAAWRYLSENRKLDHRAIIIFGRSLGAAPAAELAVKVKPRGLILESSFSSAKAMADRVLPLISNLVYLRYRFDTEALMPKVSCPVLVLHSPDDEIIPYTLGRRVYAAAREPKQFVDLKGDHNSGFLQSQPDYEISLARFVKSLDAFNGN